MLELILITAVCKTKNGKLGIGNQGNIPWNLPEDLKYFKEITEGYPVVMGRKTFDSINRKPLKNRINIVLSTSIFKIDTGNYPTLVICNDFHSLEETMKKFEKVFIIGGSSIYFHFINRCSKIYLTEVFGNYTCDTFFPEIPSNFRINSFVKKENHTRLIYKNIQKNSDEYHYLDLLKKTLVEGNPRIDRTGVGTISIFAPHIRFDLTESIPLLTTKKVPWKMCIEEMLWMLRGETNSKILENKGIFIWKGNTSREFLDSRNLQHYPEGETGPLYGWNIRRFGAKFPDTIGGFDQLMYIENLLKNDPFSRRIMWNLWNPTVMDSVPIMNCHCGLQFYVEEISGKKFLSAHMYQRSIDQFLGFPWNIFFYSVLTNLLAKRTGMFPKELVISGGDAHIYKNHVDQVNLQLSRTPRSPPLLLISDSVIIKKYEEITVEDFEIIGYFSDTVIKGEMAV
ncbi:MAG TPA: thymidylate synthase [Allocoleopsis sp.]